MNSLPSLSVLIGGAGPAGLTLAIELARRGVSFRIVDRRPSPFHGSRGKGIQPRTLEVFADLGVIDRILDSGGPYPIQLIHEDGGDREDNGLHSSAPSAAEPYGQPWMVAQFNTEAILRERLADLGGHVEWGMQIGTFLMGDTVLTRLTSADGDEDVESAYLVGADGGRSAVRQGLGIGFPGKTLGARAVVADLKLEGLDRGFWHRFHDGDRARQLSLCPLMGTDLIQLQAPVPFDSDVDTSLDGLARLIAERSGRSDLHVTDVLWASAYEMNARLADRYRSERAFLVGDAAHVHPPTGGQGLNTSIQDAYNLGWKLAAVLQGAPVSLLDTYEEERRPVAEDMLGLSTRLLTAASRGDMRRGRDAQQLDLGYPDTSLCLERPARDEGVRAGDRAPDARLTDTSGQPVRLFKLLEGPHWTLLCFENEPLLPASHRLHVHHVGPTGDVHDDEDTFRTAYAPRAGDAFLIRPDGYIGAIVGHDGRAALETYLQAVGIAG